MTAMGGYTIQEVTRLIEEALPSSYQLLEKEAERHGSWEWVGGRSDAGLGRYVVVFATWQDIPTGSPFDMEIWAGAQEGERFERKLVQALSGIDAFDVAEDKLKPAIQAAVDWAEKFAPEDLHNEFRDYFKSFLGGA
jgi:hypothetical protein